MIVLITLNDGRKITLKRTKTGWEVVDDTGEQEGEDDSDDSSSDNSDESSDDEGSYGGGGNSDFAVW